MHDVQVLVPWEIIRILHWEEIVDRAFMKVRFNISRVYSGLTNLILLSGNCDAGYQHGKLTQIFQLWICLRSNKAGKRI